MGNNKDKAPQKSIKFNGYGFHIIEQFFPQIEYYKEYVIDWLLPVFNSVEKEAEVKCEKSTSEYAYENAVDWFCSMQSVNQSIINLYVIGASHLFEQQIYVFVSTMLQDYSREACWKRDIEAISLSREINIENFGAWNKLKELKCVCDALKHAEGRSAKTIAEFYPEKLKDPHIPEHFNFNLTGKRQSVRAPLAGQDIYKNK